MTKKVVISSAQIEGFFDLLRPALRESGFKIEDFQKQIIENGGSVVDEILAIIRRRMGNANAPTIFQSIINKRNEDEFSMVRVNYRELHNYYPKMWFLKEGGTHYREEMSIEPSLVDISKLKRFLHPSQGIGILGYDLKKHLEDTGLINSCIGLPVLVAVLLRGASFFRQYWKGYRVIGWASITRHPVDGLFVPYIYEENDGNITWDWIWLGETIKSHQVTFLFSPPKLPLDI